MKKLSVYISETGQYEDVIFLADLHDALSKINTYNAYIAEDEKYEDVVRISDFLKHTMLSSSLTISKKNTKRKNK